MLLKERLDKLFYPRGFIPALKDRAFSNVGKQI